jgi:hypothetical protein
MMTIKKAVCGFLLAAQCLMMAASGFSARSVTKQAAKTSITPLHSSFSSLSEQEASYMMAKARECAFSDSCSVEQSQGHLHDILTLQVACASGTIVDQLVCGGDEDQSELAEIVARLRVNMQTHKHGLT